LITQIELFVKPTAALENADVFAFVVVVVIVTAFKIVSLNFTRFLNFYPLRDIIIIHIIYNIIGIYILHICAL
jgi:hypothetical protein